MGPSGHTPRPPPLLLPAPLPLRLLTASLTRRARHNRLQTGRFPGCLFRPALLLPSQLLAPLLSATPPRPQHHTLQTCAFPFCFSRLIQSLLPQLPAPLLSASVLAVLQATVVSSYHPSTTPQQLPQPHASPALPPWRRPLGTEPAGPVNVAAPQARGTYPQGCPSPCWRPRS